VFDRLGHQVAAGVVQHLETFGVFGHDEGEVAAISDRLPHVEDLFADLVGESFVLLLRVNDLGDVEAIGSRIDFEFLLCVTNFHDLPPKQIKSALHKDANTRYHLTSGRLPCAFSSSLTRKDSLNSSLRAPEWYFMHPFGCLSVSPSSLDLF